MTTPFQIRQAARALLNINQKSAFGIVNHKHSINIFAPEIGDPTQSVQIAYIYFDNTEFTIAVLWTDLTGLIPGLNNRHTIYEYSNPKFPDLANKQLRAIFKKWQSLCTKRKAHNKT